MRKLSGPPYTLLFKSTFWIPRGQIEPLKGGGTKLVAARPIETQVGSWAHRVNSRQRAILRE